MCIAAWLWQAHPMYQLVLLLNRDEFHDRPTKPAGWWGDCDREIMGGRDEQAGGTWLGCTRDGRLAFITNFREPNPPPSAKTRGDLPVRFLKSSKSPLEFAEEIAKEADHYNGFNLVVTDFCSKTMVYVSNRPKGEPITIQVVSPGLHVLSNAKLDTPWPKAECLRRSFSELFQKHEWETVPLEVMVEKLMGDTAKADRDCLPNTGCNPEWEFELSSIFIEIDTKMGRYGTRSTTALTVKANGKINFYEKYLESGLWKDHAFQYHIEGIP